MVWEWMTSFRIGMGQVEIFKRNKAMKLIDKDALVAEIEKRIESCAKQREDMLNVQCYTLADDASARMGELKCIQDFLDTLEVKEVKLTWKDMRQIVAISDRMLIQKGNLDDKGFYEAVLEQFKAQKGE